METLRWKTVRIGNNSIMISVMMFGIELLIEKASTSKHLPLGSDLSQLNLNGVHAKRAATVYENHVATIRIAIAQAAFFSHV